MRFLVISDTHGNIEKALDAYRQAASNGPIDGIIHLGDYERDADNIADELNCPMYNVRGNCDGDYSAGGDFKVLDTEAGRIFLTHGHAQRVKMTYMNLIYRAQELDCVAALFGHTHMAHYEEDSGLVLLNPGSLTEPADGSGGTYAIMTTSEDGVTASIIYYSPSQPRSGSSDNPKSKIRGGHLRDMLNYSDRF